MLGRHRDYPRPRRCPWPNSVSNVPVAMTASTRNLPGPAKKRRPNRLKDINIEKGWFECGAHLKQGAFETTPLKICRSCLTIMCAFDSGV
ncbi:hypothetical protein QR685DRAFT_600564 [Neurospora intermedia]|uniref:Uncharacterized protein n=1 Tax=Neurospora intermedia TaxID=5142 RepID=A0ABR3D206_NEUIN